HLTFDRKARSLKELARALEATKEPSQLRFEIIVNNITQLELDKIKALAQQQEAQKVMPKTQQVELD
ncbi:MAG: hypothetical protein PUP92_30830, partial [Rhizonema sp. PD38]|nr:hypothetical protein [Rhizonema sp. PD38]